MFSRRAVVIEVGQMEVGLAIEDIEFLCFRERTTDLISKLCEKHHYRFSDFVKIHHLRFSDFVKMS